MNDVGGIAIDFCNIAGGPTVPDYSNTSSFRVKADTAKSKIHRFFQLLN